MAGLIGDTEDGRFVDRIKAIAFKEARNAVRDAAEDPGATVITRKWVAQKLGRTERWVTLNWNKRSVFFNFLPPRSEFFPRFFGRFSAEGKAETGCGR